MNVSVLNTVVCEQIRVGRRVTLVDVGPKWSSPPTNLAVWIELHNPSERDFSVAVQVWRGRNLLDESPTELVLAGQPHWQTFFQWESLHDFKRKTYTFVVLVDDVRARTIMVDFGAGTPS